jgi:hypothetical protein
MMSAVMTPVGTMSAVMTPVGAMSTVMIPVGAMIAVITTGVTMRVVMAPARHQQYAQTERCE